MKAIKTIETCCKKIKIQIGNYITGTLKHNSSLGVKNARIIEVKNQVHKYKTNYKSSLIPKLLLCSVSKSAF